MQHLKKLSEEELLALIGEKNCYELERVKEFTSKKSVSSEMMLREKGKGRSKIHFFRHIHHYDNFVIFSKSKKSFISCIEGFDKERGCIGYNFLTLCQKRKYRFAAGDPFLFCGKVEGIFIRGSYWPIVVLKLKNGDILFAESCYREVLNKEYFERYKDQSNLPEIN